MDSPLLLWLHYMAASAEIFSQLIHDILQPLERTLHTGGSLLLPVQHHAVRLGQVQIDDLLLCGADHGVAHRGLDPRHVKDLLTLGGQGDILRLKGLEVVPKGDHRVIGSHELGIAEHQQGGKDALAGMHGARKT